MPHRMDRKKYGDLHSELLKKRLYDSVVSSFFTSNSVPRVGDGILNDYLTDFVTIGNVTGSKFFKPHPVLQISHRKLHKTSKDLSGIYCFQDALEDIPEERTDFGDMLGSCPDHKNEILKYFCETCDEPICLDCTMVDHRKHRFFYLRDVYHKQPHHVGTLLTQGRTQVESTRKSLNDVKTILTNLRQDKEKSEQAIQDHAQKMMKALEHQTEQLLLELHHAYESKEVTLRKEKQHLELMLEQLNGSCHCAEKAIKIGNELEILVIQKHLKRKLNDVKNTRKDFSSSSFQKVCYFTAEDSESQLRESMGRISVSETCPDLSIAKGEGLVRGQKGSPTKFMITAKTYSNEPAKNGGDPVSVKVQTPTNDIIQPSVQDEGTGNYSVSFTPSESGNHQVDVEINKKPIRDSPFTLLVSNPRDYSQITRPTLVFGSMGDGKGKLNLPLGVAVDSYGSFLVADSHNHRIQVFDSEGRYMRSFGTYGDKASQFNNPSDVAIDSQGNIVVCDKDNHRIQRFNKHGVFLSKFGCYGDAPGKLKRPWGVTVNTNDDVIVTDRRNNRLQVFDKHGTHLKTIGCHGSGPGQLNQPYYASVSAETGDIYVTDSNNHRIQVFDDNGNYLREFGNESNSKDTKLKYPTGIAFDADGHVIVGDQYHHRIQVYKKNGTLVTSISASAGLDCSCYPKGLAVGNDGRVIIVDSDNHCVLVL